MNHIYNEHKDYRIEVDEAKILEKYSKTNSRIEEIKTIIKDLKYSIISLNWMRLKYPDGPMLAIVDQIREYERELFLLELKTNKGEML